MVRLSDSLKCIAAVLTLATAYFTISCLLLAAGESGSTALKGRSSAIHAIFGKSRLALGSYFYEEADRYFHGGIGRKKERAFNTGFFLELKKNISPETEKHLSGDRVMEIMPWLWLAIKSAPDDIERHLVAAFWLSHAVQRPDLALQVLQEAQVANKCNYQIQLEKGRILLKDRKLARAREAFDAGLAFWPGAVSDMNAANEDKASMLLYRVLLYEAEGDRSSAIRSLREILEMFPERTVLLGRVKDLERGTEPAFLPRQAWERFLEEENNERAVCRDPDHGHGGHGDGKKE